jgi:hypothetical protein
MNTFHHQPTNKSSYGSGSPSFAKIAPIVVLRNRICVYRVPPNRRLPVAVTKPAMVEKGFASGSIEWTE